MKTKFYSEIRQKVRGWMCHQELDMSATVSFWAFDIIRKIEFAEDVKSIEEGCIQADSSLANYANN